MADIVRQQGQQIPGIMQTRYRDMGDGTHALVVYDDNTERAILNGNIMTAMGERESMSTTAQGEDIWRGNELSPAPTSTTAIPTPASAGEQMTIVSESNADNGATATGILTTRLHYLNAAGDEQVEDTTVNGTTPVNTIATDLRFINDWYALTVGSNGVSEGHIKIYKTGTAGLVYNMIHIGGNKSLVPHRMIPNGKFLILRGWHCAEAQARRVAFRIRSTDMNNVLLPGVFCFKDTEYLKQSASGPLDLHVIIPSLSILKVSGWPAQAGAEGSCGWWGTLEANN